MMRLVGAASLSSRRVGANGTMVLNTRSAKATSQIDSGCLSTPNQVKCIRSLSVLDARPWSQPEIKQVLKRNTCTIHTGEQDGMRMDGQSSLQVAILPAQTSSFGEDPTMAGLHPKSLGQRALCGLWGPKC